MPRKPTTPTPPAHLASATGAWWSEVQRDFDLEPHHVHILTAACEAWDRMCEARAAIVKHGLTFEDRFGQPHARPEVAIERDSRTAFARMLRELGLDVTDTSTPRPPALPGTAGRY